MIYCIEYTLRERKKNEAIQNNVKTKRRREINRIRRGIQRSTEDNEIKDEEEVKSMV